VPQRVPHCPVVPLATDAACLRSGEATGAPAAPSKGHSGRDAASTATMSGVGRDGDVLVGELVYSGSLPGVFDG
jgi:hypothetical protein